MRAARLAASIYTKFRQTKTTVFARTVKPVHLARHCFECHYESSLSYLYCTAQVVSAASQHFVFSSLKLKVYLVWTYRREYGNLFLWRYQREDSRPLRMNQVEMLCVRKKSPKFPSVNDKYRTHWWRLTRNKNNGNALWFLEEVFKIDLWTMSSSSIPVIYVSHYAAPLHTSQLDALTITIKVEGNLAKTLLPCA